MDLEHPLPITSQNASLLQSPPITTSVIVWEPGLAPTPQNLNRNHKRGGFFKGFINCDQLPLAVTHVIQAAVMTPSKGCSQGGRRQGGVQGEQGLRSFPPSLEPQPHTLCRRWTGQALKNNTFVIPSVWDGSCLQMAPDTLSMDGLDSQRVQALYHPFCV